ncbi:MAG: outer membrane lipoprotein carrier protein LolA [Candidatus Binatia bacterium]
MRSAIAVLLAVVALTGCTARPTPRPATGLPAALPDAREIRAALAERRSALHGLRAWAGLDYTSPEESRRAKQLLVAERPDRLRLEVFSPLGAVFVLTAADGALAAYDRSASTVYRGAASAENLRRYAQVDLPVPLAVDLMLGTPPLDPTATADVTADDGAIRLRADRHDGAQVIWLSPALDPLRYETQDRDGRVVLRTTFEGWTAVDGARVPSEVSLEMPALQRSLLIELRDIEVNPVLPPALFALQTPSNSREVRLDGAAP